MWRLEWVTVCVCSQSSSLSIVCCRYWGSSWQPTSILTHVNQEIIKIPHPSTMNINDMFLLSRLRQTADPKRHSYSVADLSLNWCPGRNIKGVWGFSPRKIFYNWRSKTYSFGNFCEEKVSCLLVIMNYSTRLVASHWHEPAINLHSARVKSTMNIIIFNEYN